MTVKELWELPVHEFNEWRVKNDLPKLFKFFENHLPHFSIWLEQYRFSIDFLIEVRNPGELFYGKDNKYLIENQNVENDERFFFCVAKTNKDRKEIERIAKEQNQKFYFFEPYIIWGQKKTGKSKFIPTKLSGYSETLRYTNGMAIDLPEYCQRTLLSGITVLKLGGVTLRSKHLINGRNLDFTNLDFLNIEWDYHGNVWQKIFYSHCNNITLSNAKLDFFSFIECDIQNLRLEKESSIYSFLFQDGILWHLRSVNSTIKNVTFDKTSIAKFDLQNTFIEEINYLPRTSEWFVGKASTYESIADNFRRFRICYSKLGNRVETKECYYQERKYEMLCSISKINAFNNFYKVSWSIKKIPNLIFKFSNNTVSSITHFRKSIVDVFNYLLWGFGERPNRLLIISFLVIFLYSILYFILKVSSGFYESLYLSTFSFIKASGMDTKHLGNSMKLLISSETLLGWILIVLIINGYANKTKY
jgi:hypothetical protein